MCVWRNMCVLFFLMWMCQSHIAVHSGWNYKQWFRSTFLSNLLHTVKIHYRFFSLNKTGRYKNCIKPCVKSVNLLFCLMHTHTHTQYATQKRAPSTRNCFYTYACSEHWRNQSNTVRRIVWIVWLCVLFHLIIFTLRTQTFCVHSTCWCKWMSAYMLCVGKGSIFVGV